MPKEDEDDVNATGGKPAAKGKAPPKKGAKDTNVEEVKPTHCRGWLDMAPLQHPGARTVTQRVFINQITAEEANYPYKKGQEDTTMVNATSS